MEYSENLHSIVHNLAETSRQLIKPILGGCAIALASNAVAIGAPTTSEQLTVPKCSEPTLSSTATAKANLHVSGNQLLNGDNQLFVPEGISIFGGLQDGDYDQDWEPAIGSANAQIEAAPDWHANTVRIQVAEGNVFHDITPGLSYNAPFLATLCQEVQLARSQGEDVIINDQTEFPNWNERNPTESTEKFWQIIAATYKNQPGIIFDLFNEPRLVFNQALSSSSESELYRDIDPATASLKDSLAIPDSLPVINNQWIWKIWQKGGYANDTHYIGMQALVDEIRGRGIDNVIEIEGPWFDDNLSLAENYPIKGKNIIWSIHHPALNGVNSWDRNFGYLSDEYPVIIGEWSQFASPTAECYPNAPTMVPKFLQYAHEHNMGVLGWSLQAGSLLADKQRLLPTNVTHSYEPTNPFDLMQPSQIQSNYACNKTEVGQGAGQLLLNYFKKYGMR
jgi:hypothetical protein